MIIPFYIPNTLFLSNYPKTKTKMNRNAQCVFTQVETVHYDANFYFDIYNR